MLPLLVLLISLSVVITSSNSMVRKGRMTRSSQRVLVGIVVLLTLAVAAAVLVDRIEAA